MPTPTTTSHQCSTKMSGGRTDLMPIRPMRQTLTGNSLIWTDSATKSIALDDRREILTRRKESSGDLAPIRPARRRDSRMPTPITAFQQCSTKMSGGRTDLTPICPMRQTLTFNSLLWTDSPTKSIVLDEGREIMTRCLTRRKESSGDLTPIRPARRDSTTNRVFDDDEDDSSKPVRIVTRQTSQASNTSDISGSYSTSCSITCSPVKLGSTSKTSMDTAELEAERKGMAPVPPTRTSSSCSKSLEQELGNVCLSSVERDERRRVRNAAA
jgi:hypothetical protein